MPELTAEDRLFWMTAAALSNPTICTGKMSDWELQAEFPSGRTGIRQEEIIAAQAFRAATAVIKRGRF